MYDTSWIRGAFRLWPLALLVVGLACKKDDPQAPEDELVELVELLASAGQRFDALVDQDGLRIQEAVIGVRDWLQGQPGVATVHAWDSISVFLTTANGLQGSLFIDRVDATGNSLYRGGGAGTLQRIDGGGDCGKPIDNKRILFFNAEPDFAPFSWVLSTIPEDEFEVTSLTGPAASMEALASIHEYGLVVFNTHGVPNGIMIGGQVALDEEEPATALASMEPAVQEGVKKKRVAMMYVKERVIVPGSAPVPPVSADANTLAAYVNSAFIADGPSLDQTILFGNYCYSGQTATDNLPPLVVPAATAWLSRNPASFYGYRFETGYSYPVSSEHCRARESDLLRALTVDKDSTGIAHLDAAGNRYQGGISDDAVEQYGYLYLEHDAHPDHCFGDCAGTFTDSRDGKEYRWVCVGNQIWMAENLNYASPGSYELPIDPGGSQYGRYYQWWTIMGGVESSNSVPSGVQGPCPDGWHLPSDAEWTLLETAFGVPGAELDRSNAWGGIAEKAGRKMKAETGWPDAGDLEGRDSLGLAIRPGGFQVPSTGFFEDVGVKAWYWSTTKEEFLPPYEMIWTRMLGPVNPGGSWDPGSGEGIFRGRLHAYDVAMPSIRDESTFYPCRCVKDP